METNEIEYTSHFDFDDVEEGVGVSADQTAAFGLGVAHGPRGHRHQKVALVEALVKLFEQFLFVERLGLVATQRHPFRNPARQRVQVDVLQIPQFDRFF